MSRSPCCGEASGRCEKPENSQEVTFLRLTPQLAFKEVDAHQIGDLCFYIHCENMSIFYNGRDGSVENNASKHCCKTTEMGRGMSSFGIQGSRCTVELALGAL